MSITPALEVAGEAEAAIYLERKRNEEARRWRVWRGGLSLGAMRRWPKLCRESHLAIAFCAVFGVFFVWFAPPLITFDGPGHFFRALQISRGDVRPERYSIAALGGNLPASHKAFVDELWHSYWVRHDFGSPRSWAETAQRSEKMPGEVRTEFSNIAIYGPLNYVPQAAGMWVAARFTASPLAAHRMGAMFNLVAYATLVVAALELLPGFRAGLLLLATSPLLIFQAASVSADALNFALPVLVVAWTWRLRARATEPRRTEVIGLLATALLLASLKPTTILWLGVLVGLPVWCFGSIGKKVAALGACAVASAVVWFAWHGPYLDVDVAQWFDSAHSAADQKRWFGQHPGAFWPALRLSVTRDSWGQWPAFFAYLGDWVPVGIFQAAKLGSLGLLIGVLGCPPAEKRRDFQWAGGLAALGAASFVGIGLTLWLAYGTREMAHVPYLGGRYFTVVYFALALAWVELAPRWGGMSRRVFLWGGLAANTATLAVLAGFVAVLVLG